MGWQEDLAAAMKSGELDNLSDESTGNFRKAGSKINAPSLQISSDEINELLTPWEDYERDERLPNYYGRNEEEWRKDNNRIRDLLIKHRKSGKSNNYLRGILRNNGFNNEGEQYNIIRNLRNKDILHTEDVFVPGAAGDEQLSKALLDYSGFTPVSLENQSGDTMATDLRVTIDGAPRYVDAQQRVSNTPTLFLDLVKGAGNRRYGGIDIVKRNPGASLLELTKLIRDAGFTYKDGKPSVIEGKLLHTNDNSMNPIMSPKIATRPTYAKDYLISSDRRGYSEQGMSQGSYNRTKPYDWDLVDLRRAREILLPLTRSQMYDKYNVGIRQGNFSGAVQLILPSEFIKKELLDRKHRLSNEAVFKLTRPYKR